MSPDALYAEAFRVLRPGGVLAVAGYHFSRSRPQFNLQDLTSCHSHCHPISCVALKTNSILFGNFKGNLCPFGEGKSCCFRPDNQELQEAFDTVYEVQLLEINLLVLFLMFAENIDVGFFLKYFQASLPYWSYPRHWLDSEYR